MVFAARRSYTSAVRATRSSRPPGFGRARFARTAVGACFVAGTGVLSLIGIVAPSRFGQPGADTLRSGWPLAALVALVAITSAVAFLRITRLVWAVRRIAEPYQRPLEELPEFDEVAEALATSPAPLRTPYAISFVWGPALAAIIGTTFAFSTAYFVVDAVLGRFQVGWAHPIYAVAFAALSWFVFLIAGGRLATWRLAASVHKEVTSGYPA